MGSWRSFYIREFHDRQDRPPPPRESATGLEAAGDPSYTPPFELPGRSVEREIRPVVLLHLVDRRPDPLLRFRSADLAHLARVERHHRSRALHQHDAIRHGARQAGSLPDVPTLPHAVLRLELRRAGEGPRVRADLLSALAGDGDRAGRLRGARRAR